MRVMDKAKEFEVGCRMIGVSVTEEEAYKLYKLAGLVMAGLAWVHLLTLLIYS